MKKLYTIALSLAVAATSALASHHGGDIMKLDVKTDCDVQKHGIKKVIATAAKYNKAAKEHGVEFRRLNVNNSDLIKSVEEAIKTGAKEVNPMHFKGKKASKTKLPTDYAAWRACSFSIRALQQEKEAESTWRLAVPGDGFKY
jgi:hypothetical protein